MAHSLYTKLVSVATQCSASDRVQFESCPLSQDIVPYHDLTLFNTSANAAMEVRARHPCRHQRRLSALGRLALPLRQHRLLRPAQGQPVAAALVRLAAAVQRQFGSKLSLRQHFATNTQTSVDAQRVEFTPCSLGAAIYATLKVKNLSSEIPSVWRAEEHLSVRPGK